MKHPSEDELEQWAGRELAALPLRKAPPSLADRVMTAIAAQTSLPWWRQAWFAWPRTAQMTSAVLAGIVILVMGGIVTFDWAAMASGVEWVQHAQGIAGVFSGVMASVAGLVADSVGVAPTTLSAVAVALGLLFYLGCLGLGTVFYRFTFRTQ